MTATYTAGFEHRTAHVKFMYNETAEVPQFVYEEEEPTNAFVSDQDQRGFKFVSVSSNGIMIVTFCWSSLSIYVYNLSSCELYSIFFLSAFSCGDKWSGS